MKLANCILAAVLVCMTYFVRFDLLLVVALFTTALLSVLTLFPSVREMLIRSYAVLNMLLMFFYFYRFFSAVPLLETRWYVQIEYLPIWIVLVGAFASMHILADYSCCLKRETKSSEHMGLLHTGVQLRERRAESRSVV